MVGNVMLDYFRDGAWWVMLCWIISEMGRGG